MAETTVAYHLSVGDHNDDGRDDFVLNRRWTVPMRSGTGQVPTRPICCFKPGVGHVRRVHRGRLHRQDFAKVRAAMDFVVNLERRQHRARPP